jgi:alkylation response protein AidB-like acyl-CoA dehydrogenase
MGGMVDFDFSDSAKELRETLRSMVGRFVPPEFLGAFTANSQDLATTQAFSRILGEQRILAPAWPSEFGGGDRDIWEQTVLREEMWAHHEPRGAQYMGIKDRVTFGSEKAFLALRIKFFWLCKIWRYRCL